MQGLDLTTEVAPHPYDETPESTTAASYQTVPRRIPLIKPPFPLRTTRASLYPQHQIAVVVSRQLTGDSEALEGFAEPL